MDAERATFTELVLGCIETDFFFAARIRNLSRVSNEKDDGKGKGETQNTDEMSRLTKNRGLQLNLPERPKKQKLITETELQHTEAARMLPALGFCFHTRFRHRFRFGFGTNCWAALRRGWRLCGTAGLCRSRAACCATTGGNPWSGGRVNGGMDTTVG